MPHVGAHTARFKHFEVRCTDCATDSWGVPMWEGNFLPYKQTCHLCGKSLSAGQSPAWCELFPKPENPVTRYGADWKVYRVVRTNDRMFPFHVQGHNRCNGESFSWSVPDLDCDRYDLSEAVFVRAKLGSGHIYTGTGVGDWHRYPTDGAAPWPSHERYEYKHPET